MFTSTLKCQWDRWDEHNEDGDDDDDDDHSARGVNYYSQQQLQIMIISVLLWWVCSILERVYLQL